MDVRTLTNQLAELGVEPGAVLIVHTAFSQVKPVQGGPEGLIEALLAAVGTDGTLVMPSMSDDDETVFDRRTTPCRAMGIVADTYWRLPGVLRTDSPHAFAARGKHAAAITADQPLSVPHGLDSPVGRVYELDGSVLLLGVGHDANTTLHLAENLAGVRYGKTYESTVRVNGEVTRQQYFEADHCCERFALVDAWLDEAGLQRRAAVGRAEARLFRSRDVVRIVLDRLHGDETLFLHSPVECSECDESRSGLARDATV